MEVKINVSVRVPDMTEIRSRFTGKEWATLCAKIAADMGAQVRSNLVRRGRPSGDFPPLSGFNGNRVDTGRTNKGGKRLTTACSPRNVSKHTGYARRKEKGKTPGKGRYGPADKLRDTEAMAKSITGIVVIEGGGVTRVYVDAPGQVGNRPTNNELLLWHATGAGDLPVRNPADPAEMKAFEARTQRRLEEILAKPPPPAPPPA